MSIRSTFEIIFSALAIISLQGCGGGIITAPPATSSLTTTNFTSWSAVQPNTTVKATGTASLASYHYTGQPGNNLNVTSLLPATQTSGDALLTYDSNLALIDLVINTHFPQTSVSWQGMQINCTNSLCTTQSSSGEGVAINAFGEGWNYQTFGVWITYDNTTLTGYIGAMSVGSLTPVSGIPASGSATYTGLASGYYINSGIPYLTSATMDATANFSSLSINFSTIGTSIVNLNTGGSPASASNLDMTGTLTYAAGSNNFSGSVTTSSATSPMTGKASGNFYGPTANEIGGTYSLTGSGQTMIGGFGGKSH